ncbi:MAG: glycosyltransferase family 4 protein [Firmicutes bacterium]|nr:glycosyltransferase family 4 protein [Bacillota bacterium]
MKKKIWLINHYATDMYFNEGGRHYWFAKNLLQKGYEPTIFCANTRHNAGDIIEVKSGKYIVKAAGNIPFVFVKTTVYSSNGLDRIINMVTFYKNLFPASKENAKLNGKPDIILASSVHPLTLVAGIQIAKKFGIPCICEVRDLWPETFVDLKIINRNNPILKLLYAGEKWIYKKADKLIFTMEGGKDYIIEKGWDKSHHGPIDISKVYHINNGVDLEEFDYNRKHYIIEDKDLEDENTFKVVYTGSIRLANKVGKIIDAAKLLSDQNVKFLIWGDGDQLEPLRKRIKSENIRNICFKGRIDKKYIPYITSKANLNIILYDNVPLFKYGSSSNKMFDSLASGRPTLFTAKHRYSIISQYGAGLVMEDNSAESIAESIMYFKNLNKNDYDKYCINARKAAQDYDFQNLTKKLLNIIEE